MKYPAFVVFWCWLLCVFTAFTPRLLADLRIVGSDLLGADFTRTLQDFAKRNDLELQIELNGSHDGLKKLQASQADLALLLFAPGETPPPAPWVALPVAYHTAVVVVPASLPLTQINYTQLNQIYADETLAPIKRWSELGVLGPWANRSVLPALAAQEPFTTDLFRYQVLTKPVLKPTINTRDDAKVLINRLSGDEGGMALLPMPPENQTAVKTLLVARQEKDVAYGATADNLHTGDYPLRMPLYLVFRKGQTGAMPVMVRYFLSPESAAAWKSARVFPLPAQAAKQLLFDLER